jgi:hypothetical protein
MRATEVGLLYQGPLAVCSYTGRTSSWRTSGRFSYPPNDQRAEADLLGSAYIGASRPMSGLHLSTRPDEVDATLHRCIVASTASGRLAVASGCSSMARTSAFQADDEGSTPFTRSNWDAQASSLRPIAMTTCRPDNFLVASPRSLSTCGLRFRFVGRNCRVTIALLVMPFAERPS